MRKKRPRSDSTDSGKPNWHTIAWISFGLVFIALALVKGRPLTEPSGNFRGGSTYGIQALLIGLGFLLGGVYLMINRNKK